jgi:hypothetical protein
MMMSKSKSKSSLERRGGRAAAIIEPLPSRVMLSVTAALAGGTLFVTGDDQNNVITISRTVGGTILVNNGTVTIVNAPATVNNTNHFHLVAGEGNDNISLDETNGPLPGAALFGGPGNDTLTGGSGIDFGSGETGNDTIFLRGGTDDFQWNPGDGSDILDGGAGRDEITFNGSDVAEAFELSANGDHARLTRDVGAVNMDLNDLEELELNVFGGADTITVDDQLLTGLNTVNLDLRGTTPAGDNQADAVIINGSNVDDVAQISSTGTVINATVSFIPTVNITGSEGGLDTLSVNTLGGNDIVDASDLFATNASQLIRLTENGGTGNDILTGSQGFDTFVWNSGDGNDAVDGIDGEDALVINGSDAAEKFSLSTNGDHDRFTRDIDGAMSDFANVEEIDLNPLGGADAITVNDLSGSPVEEIRLNLAATPGLSAGDGQADSVIVNGRDVPDLLPVIAHNAVVAVDGGFTDGSGLPYFTVLTSVEAGDSLRVNGNGGDDTIEAQVETPINLSFDGGNGRDTLDFDATAAASVAHVLPSSGDDLVRVNVDGTGVANVVFDATQRIGALSINSGGVATLSSGGAKVLTTTGLVVAGSGKLNLTDNNLILDYSTLASPISGIRSLLASGRNGGAWNGSGILTSAGDASHFALGFGEAGSLFPGGTFAGRPVDATAVVVKFTRYGDANLDGQVDVSDLGRLATNWQTSGRDWSAGDFNYDSSVDVSDLGLLATNWQTSVSSTASVLRMQSVGTHRLSLVSDVVM